MITSFRSKRLERYWTRGDARRLPADHLKRLDLRLDALNQATSLADMDVPGWNLHALSGDMACRHAVKVTGNWRLPWQWDETGPSATDVDYEDYH